MEGWKDRKDNVINDSTLDITPNSNRWTGRDSQYTVHSTSHQTVTDAPEEIVNIQY